MSLPKKRRRRKLLLKAAMNGNDGLIKKLSQVYPIYDLADIETGTAEQKDVATAIDNYYLAYDPEDDEEFDMINAGEPSFGTLQTVESGLDDAIGNWE